MEKDFRPEFLPMIRSDEFLPRISRWTQIGGLVLLTSVGAIAGLATTTQYNVTVRSGAVVRPTGDLRIVQAATEGTIESIEVKANQTVKVGDPIAYINDSELENKKRDLQSKSQQGNAQIAQIDAQIRSLDAQISAAGVSVESSIASAQADIERINRELSDRQLAAERKVIEAQAQVEFAREQLARFEQVQLEGPGAIAEIQVSEKRKSVEIAEAQLLQAQVNLNPSDASVTAAQQQIGQRRAEGDANLALLNRQREELIQRQIQVRDEMSRAVAEVKQVELALSKTVIRSTVDGVILSLNLRNDGQVVRAGEAIAQIAPVDAPFTIISYVPTQERAKVEIGQKVQLRVSAYPYPDYGVLNAKVVAIAPDVKNSPTNINPDGAENPQAKAAPASYEVTIQPEQPYLEKGGQKYPIQAGMEAQADIISKEETVLTYILRKMRLMTDL
jgi:HlyD family type I secretion membrane fusion protein